VLRSLRLSHHHTVEDHRRYMCSRRSREESPGRWGEAARGRPEVRTCTRCWDEDDSNAIVVAVNEVHLRHKLSGFL
ncbi:unnamed protein product, partial [Symbiodinium sp. CCMP2456]